MSKLFIFTISIVSIVSTKQAMALESAWSSSDHMQARLYTSADSIGETTKLEGALEQRLSPGWHTYWRSPGDAGLPPVFHWGDSENVKSVEVFYPTPSRLQELDFTTFGYKNSVSLPFEITLETPGSPAKLALGLETMLCKDICIPQRLDISLNIPAGDGVSNALHAQSLLYAKEALPLADQPQDLQIENVEIGPAGVVISAYSASGFDRADTFVEVGDLALTAAPDMQSAGERNRSLIRIAPPHNLGESLQTFAKGKEVRVTITNGRAAVEKTILLDDAQCLDAQC